MKTSMLVLYIFIAITADALGIFYLHSEVPASWDWPIINLVHLLFSN